MLFHTCSSLIQIQVSAEPTLSTNSLLASVIFIPQLSFLLVAILVNLEEFHVTGNCFSDLFVFVYALDSLIRVFLSFLFSCINT